MSEPQSPKTNPAPLNPGRVGFVGLAGVPNVGKSTLVNRLVGQKISIVSDRPQTTRERVCGIYTDARMQAVMVDIPGILNPKDAFNKALMDSAALGLMGCDLVWHIRDARRAEDPADEPVRAMIRDSRKRVWLIWNKVDRVPSRMFPARADDLPYERVFGISAKTGRGVEPLLDALAQALPEGQLLYDPEQLSDRDLRFLAAELVREKLFRYLGDEIPYALATSTETFDEESQPGRLFIRVEILTEREAHKPIIIGEKGAMLKKIGQAARLEIERLVEQPVFLELWVKVRPRWRKDERQLKELGLKPPNSY